MKKSQVLNELLQGYVHVAAHQIGQTAACNRLHHLDERCCRWLLVAHDGAHSDSFLLTHEFLAMMLGVQRAGVTMTASMLQRQGLIRYSRGRITITDRAGLEASSCECYEVIRDQLERLFSRRKPFDSRSTSR
jgi:CRP-like cAMP-binding protein